MNIIETNRLTCRFGKAVAVRSLDLAVPEGSITALLGPNGAGKTTTIKMLMNLVTPTFGEAKILGVDSRKLGESQLAQIGYVSENQEMPLWMTVRQLLDFCRPFYPTWDRALEASLLRKFELPEDRKLKHLSRGMFMKAALLSSLSYRPKLLILDEPFSGLDPVVRDDFTRGVIEVSETGGWTVLISSHDIEEIEKFVDRVAIINRGELRFNESAEALQSRFRQVHIADAGPQATPPAGAIGVERSGRTLVFVATDYDDERSEQAWRQAYPDTSISVQPMTLRQIFLAQARSDRPAEGNAA